MSQAASLPEPRDEHAPEPEIPEGMSADARATWPSRELIDSWLGSTHDVELWPGETIQVDTEEQAAQARHFRDVLSRFASGVAVVTAMSGDTPVGMTCQSFSSVSLDPPLVLFCPARSARAWPLIQRSGRFCVNVLADDQSELSNRMASRGTDKYSGVSWTPSPESGSPLLEGAVAHIDCAVHAVHEAGDHYVVLGRVLDLGEAGDDGPEHGLTFYRGAYGSTRPDPA